MTIKLYITNDVINKIEKTLIDELSIECHIYDNASIITPVVITANQSCLTNYNYCYIDSYKRYYFITNIEAQNDGFVKISLSCDVLYSYKDVILSSTVIARRSTNKGNARYYDDKLPTSQQTQFQIKTFPLIPLNSNAINSDTKCFVLSANGGE